MSDGARLAFAVAGVLLGVAAVVAGVYLIAGVGVALLVGGVIVAAASGTVVNVGGNERTSR